MKFPTEKHLQEFDKDKFGYKILSKKILDEILVEMELPNCFGLYGNWGSGKSTILDYIKQHLKNDTNPEYKKVTLVSFESWGYEFSDQKDLLFALLRAIKKQGGAGNHAIWTKLMINTAVVSSGILRQTHLCDLQKTAKDFEIMESKVFDENERWVDKVEEFKDTFEKVVEKVLQKNKTSKLVVFIDDLDRCLPENAVKLLEGIKNFLSVKNTLFVLAIDRRIISEMIEKKYGLHYGYGDEYLMKIVHYYYELPTVDLKDVVENILAVYQVTPTNNQKNYIVQFLADEAREPRIAKHILRQLGVGIALSEGVKKRFLEDKDGKDNQLQYIFVASFLLTKFPNLFSTGDSYKLLRNIAQSAAIRVQEENHDNKYGRTIEGYNINPEIRKKLEDIILHPIFGGHRLISDMELLNRIMKELRVHSTN